MSEAFVELLSHNLILQEPYTIEVQLICVQPSRGSEVIKYLCEKYPLSKYNLSHLKRAQKPACKTHIDIIIAPKDQSRRTCGSGDFLIQL